MFFSVIKYLTLEATVFDFVVKDLRLLAALYVFRSCKRSKTSGSTIYLFHLQVNILLVHVNLPEISQGFSLIKG